MLGGIALITTDPNRRQKALAEAERLLDAGSVSHNYFAFYIDATESAADYGEWDRLEVYADRMEAYASAEPLPWSDFIAARARTVAAWGRGEHSTAIFNQLHGLRDRAVETGLVAPAIMIDAVLASAPNAQAE